METTYSADVDHIDEPILEAAGECTKVGETIRVRVQPSIWRRPKKQHRMWTGVSWTVDCATVVEAISLREAMRAFFDAISKHGAAQVIALLAQLETTQ